jgi:hypothetical protein
MAIACAAAWVGPGNAAPAALSPRSERALRAQVLAWWMARAATDHQTMYALYEPAYRAKVSFAEFLKESAVRTRFGLSDPEILSMQPLTSQRVRVKVKVSADLARFGSGHKLEPEETWVLRRRRWYKVYEPPALPFPTQQ